MRKFFSFLAIAAVVLGMASCGDGNTPEQPTPVGAINGKFSVAPGKQVYFSRGNLQYNAFHDKWRFAENQWDYVGDATDGTVKIGNTKCNNANVSPSYNGWIDYFGWGTGMNPTNTSKKDADYQTFTDWGNNPISNGGNQAYLWRTLTNDEWNYLLFTRVEASDKIGAVEVNNIPGYVLLPDNWQLPNGCEFTPGILKAGSFEAWSKMPSTNLYSGEVWDAMERAGAVFLPVGGDRWQGSIEYVGIIGLYWSCTSYDNDKTCAYSMGFSASLFTLDRDRYYDGKSVGATVRLVQDVK